MVMKMTASKNSTKRTLAAVLVDQIRERIISGRIEPGTQMNEVELAQRFSTSRGPVREAMQRLVQEGLLVSKPHRGTYVPRLDQDDLADLAFARTSLERAAIERVLVRGASAGLISKLEYLLEKIEIFVEQEDWHGVADADVAFHEAIVEDARSFQLSRMYASLAGQTRLSFSLRMPQYQVNSEELIIEHRRIAELLFKGDDGVYEALSQHLWKNAEIIGSAGSKGTTGEGSAA